MGCYDSVMVPCPACGRKAEFQSKGGECLLRTFELGDAPGDVMLDVNRHAPCKCEDCGTAFRVVVDAVPAAPSQPFRVTDDTLKEILADKGWGDATDHPVEDLANWNDLVRDLKSARDQIAVLTALIAKLQSNAKYQVFNARSVVEPDQHVP